MSTRARLLTLLAIVVIAAGAFLAMRPSDDDATSMATTPAAATTTPTATTTESASSEPPRIRLEGGQPVGGLQKLTVKQGGQIHFTVVADAPESVHLHGYDIEQRVVPGEVTSFSVPAVINGVFEIELEDSGVQLAKLTVEP